MTKIAFIFALRDRLSGLPQEDTEERLRFYCEMIEDRMEDGLSEEEAVAAVGSIDAIVAEIADDIPLLRMARERILPKRRLRTWEILLLAIGSPLWLSLLIAAAAVLLSLYVTLWALTVSVYAVFASAVGCVLGAVLGGIVFICTGNALAGVAMLAAALVSAGLSLLLFYAAKAATVGVLWLTKKILRDIKRCFLKGGKRDA